MAQFTDFFFRPNLQSTGTIPASAPLYTSPDIICAQNIPIEHFTDVLKENYATAPGSTQLKIGYDNYLYIRGKNNSGSPVNRQLSLYYAPSALINWPNQWVGNVIPTDKGTSVSIVTNVAAGAVAVAPDPFLWRSVPQPPSGSHYCLFSYSTDPQHPQPIPGSQNPTYEDMAALVTQQLNIGWKNMSTIVDNPPTWTSQVGLSIPTSVLVPQEVFVYVDCQGLVGGSVSFDGSNSEGASKPIHLDKTDITETPQISGIDVILQPGFHCTVSVNFWSNSHTFAPGSSLNLEASYEGGNPTSQQYRSAAAHGLIDAAHLQRFKAKCNIQPHTPIFLGWYKHVYA